MKKIEMVRLIAQICECRQDAAAAALDSLLAEWGDVLARGERLQLPGIGRLGLTATAERQGRNPRTGETVAIEAGHRGNFRLAQHMKDRARAAQRRRVPRHAAAEDKTAAAARRG